MIIECTSCQKKFNVPDSAITSAGRLVQCSSCGNQWTQYPLKTKTIIKKSVPAPTKTKITKAKTIKKKSGPAPYSREYMQQKWGTSLENYAVSKGLSNKIKKLVKTKKIQKQKSPQILEKVGYGFFNYLITISVLSIFIIGILNFERGRITRKFPMLEPYIDHFFEALEIFKIIILDFFR